MNSNIFEIFYNFFNRLIDYSNSLWEWLNSEIDIIGYKFTPLYMGGGLLIIIMTVSIIRGLL